MLAIENNAILLKLYILFMSNHIRRVYESYTKEVETKTGHFNRQRRLNDRIYCVTDLIFRDMAAAWEQPECSLAVSD
ncbi:MAG TPA: hypothetical protein PLY36_06885 [Spirochaetota bacterium]|nr:hypothetical protein [Spirochaetota bacterium]